jgi:hypothetical protein
VLISLPAPLVLATLLPLAVVKNVKGAVNLFAQPVRDTPLSLDLVCPALLLVALLVLPVVVMLLLEIAAFHVPLRLNSNVQAVRTMSMLVVSATAARLPTRLLAPPVLDTHTHQVHALRVLLVVKAFVPPVLDIPTGLVALVASQPMPPYVRHVRGTTLAQVLALRAHLQMQLLVSSVQATLSFLTAAYLAQPMQQPAVLVLATLIPQVVA